MATDILLEIFKFLSYEEARKIREVSFTWKFVVKKSEFFLPLKVIREEMALSPNGIHFCYENFEKSNIRFSYRQFKNCCFSKLFVYVYGRNWKLTLRVRLFGFCYRAFRDSSEFYHPWCSGKRFTL
jgi:hypothetical protein